MTWNEHHTIAERLSLLATDYAKRGDREKASALYRDAAIAEVAALGDLPDEKVRTIGITAVSAVALLYKGGNFALAEEIACQVMARAVTPPFAKNQLRDLLSLIWTSRAAEEAGISFGSGDVLVSVKGGEVVHGGAPLELILRKVEGIQAILFRTVEMMMAVPIRKRGLPSSELQQMFRPWLFQAPAGSYQFAVRIQEPPQLSLWTDRRPSLAELTEKFFSVLRASADGQADDLSNLVADTDYQEAFLTLSRNLAPSGATFDLIEIRDASSPSERPISFAASTRQGLNAALRALHPSTAKESRDDSKKVTGILRAVHLDQGWIEITPDNTPAEHIKFTEAGNALDDVVGPMLNRHVTVTAVQRGRRYLYRDIEQTD